MTTDGLFDRWVVLGLAGPRSGWFADVSRWANESTIPVDFVKCVSASEIRARLGTGRVYSALLIGADIPSLDRDLVDISRSAGAAVIVAGSLTRDWDDLGVSAVLPARFERDDLVAALREHSSPVARVPASVVDLDLDTDNRWQARLVAVTGTGGTGSSIVAMALAQSLASRPSDRGLVLLADFCLDADQSMLHDTQDVTPCLQELVEAHRGGRLGVHQIRRLVLDVPDRGYHLLLGLRRHRDWTALRRRAFSTSLEGLRRAYRLIVADIDPDLEGESDTGSVDVEDRNMLARVSVSSADVVVVVGLGDLKGTHSLVRTIRLLHDHGVEPDRIVSLVNRAPKSPHRRAEINAGVSRLLRSAIPDTTHDNVVFARERRDLERAIHDGVRLPSSLGGSLATEVRRRLTDVEPNPGWPTESEPMPVAPGSVGHWAEEAG